MTKRKRGRPPKKEPAINTKLFIDSCTSSIRETYEYLKYWQKQAIDCVGISNGAVLIDTEYLEKCKQKIDKYEKKLKEDLERYNTIKDYNGEQLAKYLKYQDLIKELDL